MRQLLVAACLLATCSLLVAQEQPKPLASGDPATKAELDRRLAEATESLLQANLKARAARLELYRLGGIPNVKIALLCPNEQVLHTVPNPNPKGRPTQEIGHRFEADSCGRIQTQGRVVGDVKGVGVRVSVALPTSVNNPAAGTVGCEVLLSGDTAARLVVGDTINFDGVYEVTSLVAVEGFKEKLPVVRLVERYKLPR